MIEPMIYKCSASNMETYGIHSFIHSIINSHYASDLHQADGSLSGSPFKPAQLKHAFLLVTAMVLLDHCNAPLTTTPLPPPPSQLPSHCRKRGETQSQHFIQPLGLGDHRLLCVDLHSSTLQRVWPQKQVTSAVLCVSESTSSPWGRGWGGGGGVGGTCCATGGDKVCPSTEEGGFANN